MAAVARDVTWRFSTLAAIAVCTLVLTGSINAWLLIGGIAGLVGTPYGWFLLSKLGLLLPLLGLAAVDRWQFKLRLEVLAARSKSDAAAKLIRQLSWSIGLETLLGALVLLVVGALGVTPPGRHVDPWWPFSVRLSWTLARDDPATPVWMTGGALYAAAGLAARIYVIRRRTTSRWPVVAGAAFVAYGVMLGLFAFPVIDAYPTTYLRPTVAYQAVSIARGGELYAKH